MNSFGEGADPLKFIPGGKSFGGNGLPGDGAILLGDTLTSLGDSTLLACIDNGFIVEGAVIEGTKSFCGGDIWVLVDIKLSLDIPFIAITGGLAIVGLAVCALTGDIAIVFSDFALCNS